MAGIGFELRRVGRKETLLSPLTSLAGAAVTAAGPWLFTVLALGAIGALSSSLMTAETLSGFRAIIIYAFMLSLNATAPIAMLAVRLLSDALYLGKFERVRPLFIATMILGGTASAALATFIEGGLFNLRGALLLTGIQSSTLVGLIWVNLSFCSAVRDFKAITVAFICGLAFSVLATIVSAAGDGAISHLVDSFNLGLAIILFALTCRFLSSFPQRTPNVREPFQELWNGLHTYSTLFLGTSAGIVAVWIDKWVMWLGPSGETAVGGLLNAPNYDSAMFVAYLSIIPSLGLLVSVLETAFFDRYTHYFRSIQEHATLDCILKNGQNLSSTTLSLILSIMLFQATFCTIILLLAPLIAPVFGLNYQQIGILRFGTIGALFQFLFLVCTSLLLYFERYSEYAKLQIFFMVTSAAGTTATLFLGPATYGLGYLAASVLGSVPALLVLEKTMADLGYLTFVVGNANAASRQRLGRNPGILADSISRGKAS